MSDAGHTQIGSISHDSVEDHLFDLWGLLRFGVGLSSSQVSIGLGLLSVKNWFGFVGYKLGLDIFFK